MYITLHFNMEFTKDGLLTRNLKQTLYQLIKQRRSYYLWPHFRIFTHIVSYKYVQKQELLDNYNLKANNLLARPLNTLFVNYTVCILCIAGVLNLFSHTLEPLRGLSIHS